MIQETLFNYRIIISNLSKAIEVSGYRKDYIAKKIGISPQALSAKINRGSFSFDDAVNLLNVIDNEDVEEFFMLEKMRALKDDDTISYQEAKKELGWN